MREPPGANTVPWVSMALSLLVLLNCGQARVDPVNAEQLKNDGGVYVEQKNNDLPTAIPEVPEQSYFNFNDEVQVRLMTQLSKTPFRGIAVRAPRRIYLQDQSECPVILFSQETGLREWEVSFERNTTLVAVDLLTGRVFRGHAFSSPKKRDFANADLSMEGPRPEKADAASISSGAERLDARSLLSLPWQPARYAFTVITHDWVSNTVVVELAARSGERGRLPGYFPLERAVQIHEAAKVAREANKLPSFVRTRQTPVLTRPGVAISVPSKTAVKASTISVYGAVKIAVPFGSIVELPTLRGEKDPIPVHPTVVLTGAVLLVKKDVINPPRIEIQVPVHAAHALEEGDIIEGYFGIDLAALLPEPLVEGNYFVYFVMGEHVDGPHQMAVSR